MDCSYSPDLEHDQLQLGGQKVKINNLEYNPILAIELVGKKNQTQDDDYNVMVVKDCKWYKIQNGGVIEAEAEPRSLAMVAYELNEGENGK